MITPSKTTGKKQLTLDPNKTRMGSSGGIGIVGGAASGAVKGAFNLIKNVVTQAKQVRGHIRMFGLSKDTFRSSGSLANDIIKIDQKIATRNLLRGKNKFVPKSKPVSKPVDFKGPNPASKIGAGRNSY